MKILVNHLYTGEETILEGHPSIVARQLVVRFPFLGPWQRGEPVESLVEHLDAQQAFEAVVIEGDDGEELDVSEPGGPAR